MVLETVLVALSTAFFIGAIYFSAMLSKETGNEKYWVFLIISAVGFGISHLAAKAVFFNFGAETALIIREIGEIIGAFSLAYATFGLYTSMRRIRKKIGGQLEE